MTISNHLLFMSRSLPSLPSLLSTCRCPVKSSLSLKIAQIGLLGLRFIVFFHFQLDDVWKWLLWSVRYTFTIFFLHHGKSAEEAICFQIVRPAGRLVSVNIYFAWRDVSVLSGEISTKLGTNIPHANENCWKDFQGQRSNFKVMARRNATMAEACISTMWRRGSLVVFSCISLYFFKTFTARSNARNNSSWKFSHIIELPSCLIKKNKTSFCHGITAWRICFVDIVVSCGFFVLLCSELFFFLLFNCICLPLMMMNTVDHRPPLTQHRVIKQLIHNEWDDDDDDDGK